MISITSHSFLPTPFDTFNFNIARAGECFYQAEGEYNVFDEE
jgi:hypothetical protein